MKTITIERQTCKRCHYEWFPRGEDKPKLCPRCKSFKWETPKKKKKTKI